MKARVFAWALAIALGVASAACNREEPTPEATRQSPAAATDAAAQQTDDSTITTSVQAKYYADDAVRGRDISVATENGVVTLQGHVDSEDQKTRAVALAREVPGVTQVDDQLRVASAGSDAATARTGAPDERPSDVAGTSGTAADRQPGWITTKIQAQYFINPEIKPWNIDVTTSNNGIVRLEGEVDSADDKAEAVRIARGTEGVTRVDDRLRIKGEAAGSGDATAPVPALPRPDVWLTAKVQSKYFLDDEVKGHEIDVDAKDGVVTLSGTVATEAQHRQAVALARSTEGVRDVVDQLKVSPDTDPQRSPTQTMDRAAREVDIERPDEWVTMKIQSKYFLDPDVKGHRIDVDTNKGVVTLTGNVENDAQKREAEQIARDTQGVTRVVNQLTIKPSGR